MIKNNWKVKLMTAIMWMTENLLYICKGRAPAMKENGKNKLGGYSVDWLFWSVDVQKPSERSINHGGCSSLIGLWRHHFRLL